MAKFPDEPAFGLSLSAATEGPDVPDVAATQENAPARHALEIAKADSQYLVQTKELRDALAGEGEPDSLREKYEPLFRQAFDGGAALISDPQQRELWAQSRSPDFDGHLSATSDRAFSLTREREITGAATQLDAMRDLAVQTADPAMRSEFIQAANGLIFGLQSAGYIDEAAAKEKQKAWAEGFALAAFSKLPAAEQVKWLEGDAGERGSGKGELIDFVPADARESLLQTAQLNLRNEEYAAQSAASLERHNIEGQIRDDLAAILKDGKGIDNLSSEKVQTVLGPDALRDWQEAREDLAAIRKGTEDLYALTDAQIDERLQSLLPSDDMRDDPRKGAIFLEVQRQADELRRLRVSDPAKSVEDDPVVRAMQEGQAQSYDPQSARDLYAARLAAQERAGMDRIAQSPITKEEALALTAPLQNEQLGEDEKEKVRRAVAEEFRNRFGTNAAAAFSFALAAHLVETTAKEMGKQLLTRNGESASQPDVPIAAERSDSEIRLGAFVREALENPRNSSTSPAETKPMPAPGEHIVRTYTARSNGNDSVTSQGRDEDGDPDNTYMPIPRKAVQALRRDPDLLHEFNRKYDRRAREKDIDQKSNLFDQFDNEWDAKAPDLTERFELNYWDGFYRHTIAGAASLEIMKRYFPETYDNVVALLARYDLMPPAKSIFEMGMASAGALAGSSSSFETLIPGYKVGGLLAKRVMVGFFEKASESLVLDTLIQKSNVETGVQAKHDEDRTTKEVLSKGAGAAGKKIGNKIAKDATPRRYHKIVDWAF